MLADNINFLKKNYQVFYNAANNWQLKSPEKHFICEKTRSDQETLKHENTGKSIYVHSKYDPLKEAVILIDNLETNEPINPDTHVVFFGLGLGYHIDEFVNRYPNINFSIVEPSMEVFVHYLNCKLAKKIFTNELVSFVIGDDITTFLNQWNDGRESSVVIFELPSYKNIFSSELDRFFIAFKEHIKNRRSQLSVNYVFKERWILNSVNNFKTVLRTPNIMLENNELFRNKTALLVAAGPSLNFEIENLRKIKDKGLAFIFSVGSAISTLVENKIYPHAMCTIDPGVNNQQVFKKVNDEGIKTIPMIFGSSVGFESLVQYQGPKYHMITSQDTIADYFLQTEAKEKVERISDAPSVAVATYELLVKLGFKQILLVGQNFAYLKDKHYAEGVDYSPEKSQSIEIVKDTNGDDVETTHVFNLMKRSLETAIAHYQLKTINTTIGGAAIVGTVFQTLDSIIEDELNKNEVCDDDFSKITHHDIYNRNYLLEQSERLLKAFEDYEALVYKIGNKIKQLRDSMQEHHIKVIGKIHREMDHLIQELENNDYFKLIAVQMNRVEYVMLVNDNKQYRNEKNDLIQAKGIIDHTEVFFDKLYLEMDLNREIVKVIANVITGYLNDNNR
ncbi:motility associated factor glycosyltransferase family protein [Acetobacterium carbinolicum]|uniref:motility associated factor glycosyltransferase family protein n=1 Tax=Acetobacterium carbinolicum TaxID=52690 RepID=UPI0039C9E960